MHSPASPAFVLHGVHGPRAIGHGHPCYIIAEMSANHGHDIEKAEALIRAAAASGADAVKLQTYTADTLTIDCDNPHFRIAGTLWNGKTLYALYQEAATPWEWHPRLKACANDLGLDLFSTPFDATAVEFLESLNMPCHKVASFEAVDIPLLQAIAATGKPVILSTGMATLAEIDEAVTTLRTGGTTSLALLKCTSAYPAPAAESNLRTIAHMATAFDCPTGLSDHTMGSAVAVAAVALGASLIEKHFITDRSLGGPDADFSMEPEAFRHMVQDIRTAESAVGQVCYALTPKQRESTVFRRSLFVVRDVRQGELFTPNNVRSIRPGTGLHTRHLPEILGRSAVCDISRGTPLAWALIGQSGTR